MAPPPTSRQLDSPSFRRLLARFDEDPERAGAVYEELRRALVQFFDWRGAHLPDECADEVLDRLARKLAEGVVIDHVKAYAYRVARLVWLEHGRRIEARTDSIDGEFAAGLVAPDEGGDPPLLACLERCLTSLASDTRELILRYYLDERQAKIEARAALARERGLSANALRSKAQRVRERLERCTLDCADGPGPHGSPKSDTSTQ